MTTRDGVVTSVDEEAREREEAVRDALEDMARSLHVGYLERWGRHDPAGLERTAAEAEPAGTSAA